MIPCVRSFCCFFFNDTATTEIYTLSLHDALPILMPSNTPLGLVSVRVAFNNARSNASTVRVVNSSFAFFSAGARSEEHTSELQSHLNLVCRLLLEKKK